MNKIKVFMINTLIMFVSSLLLQIITLCFNIYISNKIGQEALGVFTLIMSVYMFGITLASAGINIATTRVVSEELASGNEISCKRAANRCVLISSISRNFSFSCIYYF